MEIAAAILHMYPQADALSDFKVIQEPGAAPRRGEWNLAAPRPTDRQLADAWIPALKARKIAEFRARVVSESEALMPVYEMLYCTRARILDPKLLTLDAVAAKGRNLEARVNAAATEADVLVVAW